MDLAVPENDILLCQATLDDIIAELGRRSSSSLILMHVPPDNGESGSKLLIRYTGGLMSALGLITWGKNWLLK